MFRWLESPAAMRALPEQTHESWPACCGRRRVRFLRERKGNPSRRSSGGMLQKTTVAKVTAACASEASWRSSAAFAVMPPT